MFDLVGNEAIIAGKYTRDINSSETLTAFINENEGEMVSLDINGYCIYDSYTENLSDNKSIAVNLYRDIIEFDRDPETGETDVSIWYYTSYENSSLREVDINTSEAFIVVDKISPYIDKYKSITEDATDSLLYYGKTDTYIYTIDNFDALDFSFLMTVVYGKEYTMVIIDDGASHREFLYENVKGDIIWFNTESLDGKAYQFSSKEMFVEYKYTEEADKQIIKYTVNEDSITIVFDGINYFADSDSIAPGTEIFIRNKYGIPVKKVIV